VTSPSLKPEGILTALRLRLRPADVASNRLAEILARLSLNSRGADGSGTMHLCEISAEVSGTTGAGIMLQSDELVRGSLCTTDGVAAYLDDLQYTLGKARRSMRITWASSWPNRTSSPPTPDRWPSLAPSALQAGARAIFALPIRIGAVRLGSLTLYRDQAGPIEGDRYTDALVMTDVAAHTIVAMQANAPARRHRRRTRGRRQLPLRRPPGRRHDLRAKPGGSDCG
jgi:hypothetical protein